MIGQQVRAQAVGRAGHGIDPQARAGAPAHRGPPGKRGGAVFLPARHADLGGGHRIALSDGNTE